MGFSPTDGAGKIKTSEGASAVCVSMKCGLSVGVFSDDLSVIVDFSSFMFADVD
jgi:hypothetical protein